MNLVFGISSYPRSARLLARGFLLPALRLADGLGFQVFGMIRDKGELEDLEWLGASDGSLLKESDVKQVRSRRKRQQSVAVPTCLMNAGECSFSRI